MLPRRRITRCLDAALDLGHSTSYRRVVGVLSTCAALSVQMIAKRCRHKISLISSILTIADWPTGSAY